MIHKQKASGLYLITHILTAALALWVLVACNQNSIFADIAVEPDPVDQRVPGIPTNTVVYDGKIYVGSMNAETLHVYKNDAWTTLAAPGVVSDLAATSGGLYLLAGKGPETSLWKYAGANWTKIDKGASGNLQSIYAAGDCLFVSELKGASWLIYYVEDGGTSLSSLLSAGPLSGAVKAEDNIYYIAARGDKANAGGIYSVTSLSTTPMRINTETNITGITEINGIITAVTWDGKILTRASIGSGNLEIISTTSDHNYTGGMSVWKYYNGAEPANGSLLLLGVSTTGSYNKGYRELTLGVDGKPPLRNPLTGASYTVSVPGSALSSVRPEDKSKYEASIARYSVYHMLQVPTEVDTFKTDTDWEPLIFASTANNGLYVLKNGQWNGQD